MQTKPCCDGRRKGLDAEDRRGRGWDSEVRRNGSPARPFSHHPTALEVVFGYGFLQPIFDRRPSVGPEMVQVGPIGEIGRLIDGIAGLQRLVIANRWRSVGPP